MLALFAALTLATTPPAEDLTPPPMPLESAGVDAAPVLTEDATAPGFDLAADQRSARLIGA